MIGVPRKRAEPKEKYVDHDKYKLFVEDHILEEHPNMQLMPVSPMNQLELMTVDQMADMILSIDESDKIRRVNYFNLACMAIRKHANNKDVRSMRECFDAYATLCGLTGIPMGNVAAYYCIGIEKVTADLWLTGKRGSTPERIELVREIKKVCAMNREAMASSGLLNPILTIFWQKNFDGFRDQGSVMADSDNLLGERQDARQIAEKYQGVIDMDRED